jgi:hypothetical protein
MDNLSQRRYFILQLVPLQKPKILQPLSMSFLVSSCIEKCDCID